MEFSNLVPVKMYCFNCGHKIIGYKDDSGGVRISCDRCKVVMYSKYHPGKREVIIRAKEPKD